MKKHSLNLSLHRGTTLATFVALLGLAFSAGPVMAGDSKKDDAPESSTEVDDDETEIKYKSKDGSMELEIERDDDEKEIDLEIDTADYELEKELELESDGRIEVEYEFEGTLKAPVTELRANFRNVNFAFDSAALSGKSRRYLSKNAKILKAHPSLKVRIEGHTDEAGSDGYNKKLGAERAAAARDFLVKKGVSPSQLETVSYGEQRPAVQVGEVRNKENRRVVFSISSKG